MTLFGLALRNIFRHRLRTSLALAAIAFGVAGLVCTGGFIQDIFVQLAEALIHSQSGHIEIARRGYFSYGSRSPERYLIGEPGDIVKRVGALPQVDDALQRLQFSGLANNGRADWPIVGDGVEASKEARLGTFLRIIAGRRLADSDGYGAVVGQGVATALHLHPGDRINLVVNTESGSLNTLDFDVVGVFQSFSRDFDAHAIKIPLRAARELLDTHGINTVVVSLRHTSDTAAVAARLASALDPASYETRTWQQLNDFYGKTVRLYRSQFGFLQAVILLMVLLSVVNGINMSIYERLGEFGTVRALGNRARHVRNLIVVEGLLLGAIGAAIGLVLAAMVIVVVRATGIPMPPPPNSNLGYTAFIRLVPSVAISAYCTGVAGAALAAVLPAIRISRMPIADALRAGG